MTDDDLARYAASRRSGREDSAPPSPFIRTLGIAAIALGVGIVGSYVLDYHRHSCNSCGHTWRHFGAFNMGNETAHTCERCGDQQWWKQHAHGSPRDPHLHVPQAPTNETPEAFHANVVNTPQGA